MNFRRSFPPVAALSVLTLLVVITTASTKPTSASGPGTSARGAGEFSFFTGQRTEHFQYSFDVQANKQGNAHGRAEFDNLTDQTQVVVRINCLQVDLSTAVMTGTVLHSDDPDFPKHVTVIFAATDAQLFPGSGNDIITPLFQFSGGDCHSGATPLTMFQQPPDAIEIEP